MNTRKFLVFVLVGGVSSVVNLVARIVINRATSYEVAIIFAFPIALTTAFILNRLFVFTAAPSSWGIQFIRFLLVNLAALAQVFVITLLFARLVLPAAGISFHSETIAHAIGLLSPIATSYWAHRHFTFRPLVVGGDGLGVRS